MHVRTRLVPFALTGVLLSGGLAAFAATSAAADAPKASIQSCYGGAEKYIANSRGGSDAYWPKDSFRRVTGHCNDINVKVNYDRKFVVCWKGHSCPTTWKQGKKGRYVVGAHINGRKDFYLKFRGTNRGTGKVAY
ncbi:hypothetical protein ACQB60_04505 [Actinomycetota bacterium Odt1-20B]